MSLCKSSSLRLGDAVRDLCNTPYNEHNRVHAPLQLNGVKTVYGAGEPDAVQTDDLCVIWLIVAPNLKSLPPVRSTFVLLHYRPFYIPICNCLALEASSIPGTFAYRCARTSLNLKSLIFAVSTS